MHPKALANPKHRKTLLYAGMAAAVLLVVLLTRRSSSSNTAAAAAQPVAQPVSNPAVDPASYYSGGTGAGGVDYGPQLTTLDTDVQTLAQAIQSQMSTAQTPGPSTPGTSGTDGGSISDVIAGIVGAVSAGAAISSGARQPGPGNTPAKPPTSTPPKSGAVGTSAGPHGAVHAPSGHTAPKAPKGFTTVGIGGGRWIFKPKKK